MSQNILITSTASLIEIKITDFGISKQEQGTQLKTTCGTENYKAPELRRLLPTAPRRRRRKGESPETYTNAVDIWSLWTLVHVILTSELPFLLTFLDEDGDCTDITIKSDTNHSKWEDEQDLDLLRDYCEKKEVFPVGSLERSLVGRSSIDFVTKLLTRTSVSTVRGRRFEEPVDNLLSTLGRFY
jgi:serine/threonine protein kinase